MADMGQENIDEYAAVLAGEDQLRSYLLREREQLRDAAAADIVASLETLLPDVDRVVLTGELAGASAHLEEGEGHLSVALGALDRMLDELVSTGSPG
jgi:hypothetical protein